MNFPLVLVSLIFLGLLIYLVDVIVLAPKRKKVIVQLKQQYPGWEQKDSIAEQQLAVAASQQARMPLPVEYARSFLPVLILVLVLRSFLIEPFQIPSSSMVPSLEVGDFILVNKYTYGIRLPVIRTKILSINEPQRGDVMVFFPPHDPRYFIKRVVGLPGDLIRYEGKRVYVNGKLVDEKLLAMLPADNPQYALYQEDLLGTQHQVRKLLDRSGPELSGEIVVKPGHYFMMGDNRDNSADSRVWGQVPEKNIVGKAFAVWLHWDKLFSMPDFSAARWIR